LYVHGVDCEKGSICFFYSIALRTILLSILDLIAIAKPKLFEQNSIV